MKKKNNYYSQIECISPTAYMTMKEETSATTNEVVYSHEDTSEKLRM